MNLKNLFNSIAYFIKPRFVNENLDARLILVVAPAFQIVDLQNGLNIGKQISFRQEVPQNLSHKWRTAQATADNYLKTRLAIIVANHAQPDVVRLCYCPVCFRSGHCNFELAWQRLKLGMIGRPLTQQFGNRARVFNFIFGRTGKMVSSHITNCIA